MKISISFHPSNFKALSDVARVTGLDMDEICRLAIHRYTRNLYIDDYNVLEPLGLAIHKTDAVLSRCCSMFSHIKSRPLN